MLMMLLQFIKTILQQFLWHILVKEAKVIPSLWIKQQLDVKLIRLQYLSTDQMIADLFASLRVSATFKVFRDYIMGYKP